MQAPLRERQDVCHALVMSGGGVNGAWEAGVIYGLTHYGNPEDFQWDVTSGVSAGCINAASVGLWAKGMEKEMAKWIAKKWHDIKTEQMYTTYSGGSIAGMMFRKAMYDTTNGVNYLTELIKGEHGGKTGFQRKVVCDAVDSETGEVNVLTETSVPFAEWGKAIMASASVPGIFPNTELLGHPLMDGMAAYNTDVEAAIKRCLEIVPDKTDGTKNIILDILICDNSPKEPPALSAEKQDKKRSPIDNWRIAQKIRNYYTGGNEIEGALLAHPNVEVRYNIPMTNGA